MSYKNKNRNYDSLYIGAYISDLFCSNIYKHVHSLMFERGGEKKDILDKEIISDIILEYIQYYIENGGYNNFIFDPTINVSANMLMLKAITDAFIHNDQNTLLLNVKVNMKKAYENITSVEASKLLFGGRKNQEDSHTLLSTDYEYKNIKVSDDFIGNKNTNYESDICMRIMPVGLYYYNEDDLDKLIKTSIKITKLTHNNIIGILAGITSAYFVSLAVRNIAIEKWIQLLIELIESDMIKNHFDLDKTDNMIKYIDFLRPFQKYRDYRFNEEKITKTASDSSLVFRFKFYNKFKYFNTSHFEDVISCLIISYDTLLLCDGNFEKVIYNGLLLPGNVISIGGYVGGLYGLIYGVDDIPKSMINFLVSLKIKDSIEKIGKEINTVSLDK
jgi:ADP-ribosylglycohydrolase